MGNFSIRADFPEFSRLEVVRFSCFAIHWVWYWNYQTMFIRSRSFVRFFPITTTFFGGNNSDLCWARNRIAICVFTTYLVQLPNLSVWRIPWYYCVPYQNKNLVQNRRWTNIGRKFKVHEDVLGRLMRGRVETHLECRCTVVSECLESEFVENFVRQANYFSCDILASYPTPGSSLNPNNNASLTWSRQKFRSFPFPKLGAF